MRSIKKNLQHTIRRLQYEKGTRKFWEVTELQDHPELDTIPGYENVVFHRGNYDYPTIENLKDLPGYKNYIN